MNHPKEEKIFLLVLNPFAGGRNKTALLSTIEIFFRENNIAFKIFESTGNKSADLASIKNIFKELKPHAVIAVGGDGTVNLAGDILIGTAIPLGIIPAGSANGLAKDLGIPLDITESLNLIKLFKPKYIDTLKINNLNCFHLSDLGFNARVCHRFADSLLRGKISYAWLAFKEFLINKNFPYQIETPLLKYSGEAFMITIANTNKFGMNATINPLGEKDDGFFEISIIKPFPKIFLPKILYQLFNDTIHYSPYYKIIKCKKAIITNKVDESFHIDGEPMQINEEIEVEIFPKGVKVFIP